MGGYSLAGRFARGHWMRLRARAFYFRDKEGNSLALVSCDLYAIPAGLQQMVAARLHPKKGQPGPSVPDISRDNLILTATHTHQSPGNYMSSEFYNGLGSPHPGFDRELFHSLAEKIAGAVAKAAENAATDPKDVELLVATATVPKLMRNRAIRAFEKNEPKVQDPILKKGSQPPMDVDCRDESWMHTDTCLRYAGVDPEMTVLLARHPDGSIPALLVFGALHPTVLAHDVSFYSPDLVGVAMRELEQREPGTVAGFFNGAEGDVSPRWVRRDIDEVEKLGRELADSVSRAVQGSGRPMELDTARIRAVRSVVRQYDFCDTVPTPGVGAMGGAEDGRFFSFDLGWRAPYRRPLEEQGKPGWFKRMLRWFHAQHQGDKVPALELKTFPILDATQVVAPPEDFPYEVPVTVARLGNLVFLAVPAEMTTAMGKHVREKLKETLKGERTIILGLANEYLEYVTTAAEYEVQEYEGGSTLFGPGTGDCYVKLLRRAAASLDNEPRPSRREQRVPSAEFRPGPKPSLGAIFGAQYWGLDSEYHDQGMRNSFATTSRLDPDFWPRVEWSEVREDEHVFLLEKAETGWVIEESDDRPDPAVATFLSDGTNKKTCWHAYWFPRLAGTPQEQEKHEKTTHFFKVDIRDGGGSICSPPFTIADIRTGQTRLPLKGSKAACPP
jgi:neutral ceramidase